MKVEDVTAERIRNVPGKLDLDEDQVRDCFAIEAHPLGRGGADAPRACEHQDREGGVSPSWRATRLSKMRKRGEKRRVRRKGDGRRRLVELCIIIT